MAYFGTFDAGYRGIFAPISSNALRWRSVGDVVFSKVTSVSLMRQVLRARVSSSRKRVLSEVTASPFSFTLAAPFALAESETTFLATGEVGH